MTGWLVNMIQVVPWDRAEAGGAVLTSPDCRRSCWTKARTRAARESTTTSSRTTAPCLRARSATSRTSTSPAG